MGTRGKTPATGPGGSKREGSAARQAIPTAVRARQAHSRKPADKPNNNCSVRKPRPQQLVSKQGATANKRKHGGPPTQQQPPAQHTTSLKQPT